MGLRILYLTAIPSGLNNDAFRGMKLAEQLPGAGGDLLVRHWLTGSRDEAVTRNPALAADATEDLDGLMSHISHRLHEDIPSVAPFIDIGIETVDGKSILRIDVPMGDKALFRRDRFFVRNNNTTHELKGESLQEYFRRRWRHA